jgi:hypothetical protein
MPNQPKARKSAPARADLAVLLRDLAPTLHPQRAELLIVVAGLLERQASLDRLLLVADGPRSPTKLHPRETYFDTEWASYDKDRRAKARHNRESAERLMSAAKTCSKAPHARLARCLAFTFGAPRGLATFHMARFVCGLPACFGEHFGRGDLGEVYGPTLGPSVASRLDLARYLVELMKADALDGAWLGSALWHGTRRVGLFAGLSQDDMVERLDRMLYERALEADPHKGAVHVLRALGMQLADARALVALAPSKKAQATTLPDFVTRALPPPDATSQGDDEEVEAEDDEGDVQRFPLGTSERFPDPWIRKIAGLSAERAQRSLAARWKTIPKGLARTRDAILRGTVLGIARGGAGTFVEVELRTGGRRYVAAPVSPASVRARLDALGSKDALFRDFLLAFDGLRDSAPGDAGGFLPLDEIVLVERARRRTASVVSTDMIESDELAGWRDAAIVYEDGTGDVLLLSPRGPIAWVRHGEGVVEPCGKSFLDFFASDGQVKNLSWSIARGRRGTTSVRTS